MVSNEFWTCIDELLRGSRVVIDRPKGSVHPRYPSNVYPLDYGYLEGTSAADRGGIDVWVGSRGVVPPEAIVCTIDLKKRDAEIKLLLGCSGAEIREVMLFLNQHSMRGLLIRRETGV